MRLRPATLADYAAFSRLFPELGPEFPVPSEEAWARMASDAVVAEDEGAVIGYALALPFGTLGHVSQLVVAPGYRRGGIGRLLLREMAQRLRAAGCDRWQLNVKRENAPAYALYRSEGLSFAGTCAWFALGREALLALPREEAFVARALEPEHDGAAEAQFGLRPGQLAFCRAHGDSLVHAVADAAGNLVGVGVFVPRSRTVSPLRVRDVRALAALLASCPGGLDAPVRIAVEENDALHALALRCGGTIDDQTDRLAAPL